MKGGIITFGIVGVFIIFLIFSFWYRAVVDGSKVIPWPPFISKCPEYWELNDNATECVNNSGVNGISGTSGLPMYNGANGKDLKELDSFNSWDGVTNAVKLTK